MGYYSKKNIEKKQWYVVKHELIGYILCTSIFDKDPINKNPLTFEKADKFRNILNKLYNN